MIERRDVHYRGRVQGVGFRFTTRTIAREFPVTGYVQNLSDGRVRLVAEGESAALDGLEAKIDEEFRGYVTGKDSTTGPATGEFADFSVRH